MIRISNTKSRALARSPSVDSRFFAVRKSASLPAALMMSAAMLLLAGCPPDEPEPEPPENEVDLHARLGPGEVVAGVLGEDGPFAEHDGRGARTGDFMLKNSEVWFVIAAADRLSDGYVSFGGGIVDADLVREEGDSDYVAIAEIHPVVSLAPLDPFSVTVLNDGTDGNAAIVQAVGRDGEFNFLGAAVGISPPASRDLLIEVDYILEPDSDALEIVTRVINDTGATVELQAGDIVMLGDDEAAPFSLPGGFDRGGLVANPPAVGSGHETRRWALAIYGEKPLQLVGGQLGAEIFGGSGSTVWLYSANSELLRRGEALEARRYLALGPDPSSVLAGRLHRMGESIGTVSGVVLEHNQPVAGARVTFLHADDASVFEGQAITGADGRFDAELPPGRYTAWPTGEGRGEQVKVPWVPEELAEGRPPGAAVEFSVTEGGEASITLELGRPGRVSISIVDPDEEPIPAKISFIHQDGGGATPEREILGEKRPYASRQYRKVFWTSDGHIEGAIRPGTYRVIASRGPAHEIDEVSGVEISAGGDPVELSFTLARVVDTHGYVGVDSHQHAAPSTDGGLSMAERIVTNVAEGLDVHLATDHDRAMDYRPLVEAFGLRQILLSIPSNELSTTLMGHHNTWPLEPEPDLANFGAPLWWGAPGETPMTLDEAYDASRALGASVIQVNHGTSSGGRGFFRAAGYDPGTGTVANPDYWSDGFNAMEVFNGKGRGGREALLPIWFSFLNRGKMIAAVAVSDSHDRIPEPGTGRTWVLTGEDDVAYMDGDEIADAVLDMRTVPSTGPFVRFTTTAGATIGDLVGMDPLVTFEIEVQAPSWITIDRVDLIANGEVFRTWNSESEGWSEGVVRFQTTTSVTPQDDTWYAVQVEGDTEMAPVYPGLYPWAITSPIFVDANGNGRFDPPW